MSDFSIELYSTEKSYAFPFKDTLLEPVALNPPGILLKQNRVGKLIFLLSDLNLIISLALTTR